MNRSASDLVLSDRAKTSTRCANRRGQETFLEASRLDRGLTISSQGERCELVNVVQCHAADLLTVFIGHENREVFTPKFRTLQSQPPRKPFGYIQSLDVV